MAQLTKIALGPDVGITDMVAQLVAVAGGGDSFNIQGNEVIVINNGNGSTCTVTFTAVADNFGIVNAAHNVTVAIPTTKIGIISGLTVARFRDVNGLCQITYSVSSSVTIGVFAAAVRGT